MRLFYFLGFVVLLGFTACQSDDEVVLEDDSMLVPDKYAEGIYVVNEGPFGEGTGTISYYNRDERTIDNNIFQTENASGVLGNIVQSINMKDEDAYIVVNNANNVVQLDAGSMTFIKDIDGLALPRYSTFVGDKVYFSQWGPTGVEGSVAVYNPSTSSIETTIATGSGAERMELVGSKLYVTNVGGFSRDSTVAVIDTNTDEVTTTILVGDNPSSIEVDANGAIWVLCKGYLDWYEPTANTDGRLVKIVNDEVVLSMTIANGSDDLVISPDGNTLYFSSGAAVMQHHINDTAIAGNASLIDRAFYSLAVDVNGNIIGGDAKDFSSAGEVVIYNSNGEELESFEVGVIPGNFFVK